MYICNLVFGLEILMPGIFLGLKFQACVVFFWVCNMKLRRTPRHVYFKYLPPPGYVGYDIETINYQFSPVYYMASLFVFFAYTNACYLSKYFEERTGKKGQKRKMKEKEKPKRKKKRKKLFMIWLCVAVLLFDARNPQSNSFINKVKQM